METQTEKLGDFDVRQVTVRDALSKRITKQNPYRLLVVDGASYYEHPKGSGNLWYGDKTHAGRYEAGKVVKGAAHQKWDPPKSEDELLAGQMASMQQENTKLMLELAEIKKEQNKAVKAKSAPKAEAAEKSAGAKNV